MAWSHAKNLKYTAIARTHVGRVRSQNEDSYMINPEVNLYAVADGMGGYEKGDAASQIVCHCLEKLSKPDTLDQLITNIELSVATANHQILKFSEEKCAGRPIGSTIVSFVASNQAGACLWAGDSRLYRSRNGQLAQLSQDHSQVAELVRLGHITPQEAKRHPHANLITRAIGTGECALDVVMIDIEANDRFLLCTDGLYNELQDGEMNSFIQNYELEVAADKLLATCLERGARDNVTFMLIQVQ